MTLSSLNQYGIGFQTKTLALLLNDKKFLQTVHDILSEDFFPNQAHQWVIQQIIKYYEKYATTIDLETLQIELQKVDNDLLQTAVKEQLKQCLTYNTSQLDYEEEEFLAFCKNQQLKKALLTSVDLLNAGDFEGIRHLIDSALQAGVSRDLGHEYIKNVEDRYREEERSPVPTPWPQVNEMLQGGLGAGDFGLVFGNPGGGKSWTMVALAGHAVKLGYNVLHYTLELAEIYVGRRYDAFFTKIPVNKIVENRSRVEELIPTIEGGLTIKEYSPGAATVNTLKTHIQKCDDLGFKPDLVIIDYADLLTTKGMHNDHKAGLDQIYIQIKALARDLQLPIWSVSQVNRAGAQDDVIEGDKAAGSYNKLMITDFCMSLSRKAEDKEGNTGRVHIMKNRYGMDGMTYDITMDPSMGDIQFLSKRQNPSENHTAEPNKSAISSANDASRDMYNRNLLQQRLRELGMPGKK